MLTDDRPYSISLHVQILVLNVQNSIYPLALPNVTCRELVIPLVSIPLTKNVMEKNLVGSPNSMYFHVGPYTPYFYSGNGGIKNVPTMWLPMFNPLINPTTPPKLIFGITQVGIVTNHRELLDEDDEYFERLYHEQRGQPSPIKNVNGLFTNERNVPTSNNGGELFNGGGNPFGGGGSSSPRGGGSRPLKD
jgi:hypothetical protein